MDKPNCYKCRHRRKVAGDAHSICEHPAVELVKDDVFSQILRLFGLAGKPVPVRAVSGLNVTGNPHGIGRGWFNWPWNFDPVWLLTCDGFEEREEESVK